MRVKRGPDTRKLALRKAGKVTIAAGFRFDEGALFCADTKHIGSMALYDPKLFPVEHANGAKSIFAIAGSVAYSKMAARKCGTAISALANPKLDDMATAVETVLLDVHKQHVIPHPDRGLVGGPDFWLLFALWSPVDGLGTYYSVQTAVDSFDTYHCAGSGDYLGHYIIRPRYSGTYGDLKSVTAVACTALQRIKAYDADCGGNSQFILMKDSGEISRMEQFDISQGEEFAQEFFAGATSLFTEMSDFDVDDKRAEELIDVFKTNVMIQRQHHAKERKRHRDLWEILSGIYGPTP